MCSEWGNKISTETPNGNVILNDLEPLQGNLI